MKTGKIFRFLVIIVAGLVINQLVFLGTNKIDSSDLPYSATLCIGYEIPQYSLTVTTRTGMPFQLSNPQVVTYVHGCTDGSELDEFRIGIGSYYASWQSYANLLVWTGAAAILYFSFSYTRSKMFSAQKIKDENSRH